MENNSNIYHQPSDSDESNQPQLSSAYIPPAVKKDPLKLLKKDFVFAAVFAAVSLAIVDFILFHGLNLGFTIAFALLFAATTAYLFNKKNNTSAFSFMCGVLSLAGSVTFTLYHDYFINFVMLIAVLLLFTVYTCGLSGTFTVREGSFKIIKDMADGIFVKPFSNSSDICKGMANGVSGKGNLKNILIGLGVSLPVLIVIIPLLAHGDKAFDSLVGIILENVGIYVAELVIAAFVAVYLVLYFVSKRTKAGVKKKSRQGYKGFFPAAASVSLLSAVALVYAVYLFSQLAYFFSAFSGILPEGYKLTASEFARRGFFEMFAICVINMALISAVALFTKKSGGGLKAVKFISAFIMAFTVLLLVTAIAKMKLNIEIFGLSKNRIIVSVFMVMMLVAIFFYVIHIFKPKFAYMQAVTVICSMLLVALGFCNLDYVIADYNIKAYNSGEIKALDVEYISELSEATAPCLVELAKSEDESIRLYAQYGIYSDLIYNDGDCYTITEQDEMKLQNTFDFREYNYTRNKARKIYAQYYNSLTTQEKDYFLERLEEDFYADYNPEYDTAEEVY